MQLIQNLLYKLSISNQTGKLITYFSSLVLVTKVTWVNL